MTQPDLLHLDCRKTVVFRFVSYRICLSRPKHAQAHSELSRKPVCLVSWQQDEFLKSSRSDIALVGYARGARLGALSRRRQLGSTRLDLAAESVTTAFKEP